MSNAALNGIVTVNITRATVTPTMASFSGILIAAEFLKTKTTINFGTTERVRVYNSMAALVADGWTSADFVYKAAAAIFSQNPSPNQIYVGRKLTGGDGSESWTTAMGAMYLYNNSWYGFVSSDRTSANQNLCAQWALANGLFYMTASSDALMLTSGDTTNIAYLIKTASNTHAAVWYSPNAGQAGEDCIDAAIMGALFPYAPGSANYAFKTLAGVLQYSLTPGQIANLQTYNANWYQTIAGVPVTLFGLCGSGEYIDVIIGIDWLVADIQNQVFTVMVQQLKVPYTDDGVQMMVTPLKNALHDGVNNSLISNAPNAVVVTYPLVASLSQANKSTRTLPSVNFTAVLAGAINIVQINGTVTY